jgi:hypothetical protein
MPSHSTLGEGVPVSIIHWMMQSRQTYLAFAENRTPLVQPVACRYTDYYEYLKVKYQQSDVE